jgi:hypothetical protein
MRPLAMADVEALRTLYAVHIPAEEAGVRELAMRSLGPADLEALGRSMAARRGVREAA